MNETKKCRRDAYRTISTPDWGILRGERIRRWPSEDDSREIEVSTHTYVGHDSNAKHFNVTVKEEDNYWWCEDENAWVRIHSDTTKTGYYFNAKLLSRKEVESFIAYCLKVIQKSAPKQKYEVRRDSF